MRQITAFCDVCGNRGSAQEIPRYPTFFTIANGEVTTQGCWRYNLYVDLCEKCFESICDAVQSVVSPITIESINRTFPRPFKHPKLC